MRDTQWRQTRLLLSTLAVSTLTWGGCASKNQAFRFLATGDVPYSDAAFGEYEQLLARAAEDNFAFFVHVGDIKGGSQPCSDEHLSLMRDLFRHQPVPMVYTPGDNEWTDCHNEAAGGHDPVERLGRLRELFFVDKEVLRLNELDAEHQSAQPGYERYVENYRFSRGRVLFAVLHVAGSNNGRNPERPESVAEYEERNHAVNAFLDESVDAALREDAAGLALIIHANPDFETASRNGQQDFITAVRAALARFPLPVVCIHGDSHYYRIDKPLRDERGWNVPHFTRMEVFGHPNTAGVAVRVDPDTPQVFFYEPYY
jgi:hypothetical protein